MGGKMAIIKVLDEILANKIAAGEVVERCSSVVKELVENSIDALSTEIKVELLESGTKEIKVLRVLLYYHQLLIMLMLMFK